MFPNSAYEVPTRAVAYETSKGVDSIVQEVSRRLSGSHEARENRKNQAEVQRRKKRTPSRSAFSLGDGIQARTWFSDRRASAVCYAYNTLHEHSTDNYCLYLRVEAFDLASQRRISFRNFGAVAKSRTFVVLKNTSRLSQGGHNVHVPYVSMFWRPSFSLESKAIRVAMFIACNSLQNRKISL